MSWTPMTFLSTPTMSCRDWGWWGKREDHKRAGADLLEQRVDVAPGRISLG